MSLQQHQTPCGSSQVGSVLAIFAAGCLATSAVHGSCLSGQQPDGASHSSPRAAIKSEGDRLVTPSIIFETQTLKPGTVVNMGISYTIEPKWHIYWNGQNDSGFAPEIDLQLPEGFEALEAKWPSPKRYVAEGDITDHIYEGRMTLIVPVRVPPEMKEGTEVTFGVKSKWLVCMDRCIPGSGSASTKILVQSQTPEKSKDSEFIEASLRSMPVAFEPSKHEVEVQVQGDSLVIKPKAESGSAVQSIAFFPAENGRSLADIASEGISTRNGEKPPRLEAKLSVSRVQTEGSSPPKVIGIIEVKETQGVKWYWFDEQVQDKSKLKDGTTSPSEASK